MGLIARALEVAGIATVMTSWNVGKTVGVAPPRATMTRLSRGATIGNPGDSAQQRRVITASLALLAHPAPLAPVMLDEKYPHARNTLLRACGYNAIRIL